MNGNKRNMLLSFFISTFFIFLSLFSFSGNEYVYVIAKNWSCGGCNKYCHDECVLVFSKQKK